MYFLSFSSFIVMYREPNGEFTWFLFYDALSRHLLYNKIHLCSAPRFITPNLKKNIKKWSGVYLYCFLNISRTVKVRYREPHINVTKNFKGNSKIQQYTFSNIDRCSSWWDTLYIARLTVLFVIRYRCRPKSLHSMFNVHNNIHYKV